MHQLINRNLTRCNTLLVGVDQQRTIHIAEGILHEELTLELRIPQRTPAIDLLFRNIARVVEETRRSPHITYGVVVGILATAVDLTEYLFNIRCYIIEIVWRRAEVLINGQQKIVLEHTLDDILRGAGNIEILLAALNLGEHNLIDVEELIDNLNLFASLLIIPLLELREQRLVNIIGPVIDLQDRLSSIVARAADHQRQGQSHYNI